MEALPIKSSLDIQHMRVQFKRLHRHTEAAISAKDEVSILDMTHCLRIWVEMRSAVDEHLHNQHEHIKWPNPTRDKQLRRIFGGTEFLHVPLATGIKTEGMQVKGITVVAKALTPEEVQQRYRAGPPQDHPTGLTFSQWLGSAVVRVTKDEAGQSLVRDISRDMLIKRVANFLGASHPFGLEASTEYENSFDPYIRELHDIEVADGHRLTHYQFMEIAQTIVDRLRPYFGSET
jgi:hypothetical protein